MNPFIRRRSLAVRTFITLPRRFLLHPLGLLIRYSTLWNLWSFFYLLIPLWRVLFSAHLRWSEHHTFLEACSCSFIGWLGDDGRARKILHDINVTIRVCLVLLLNEAPLVFMNDFFIVPLVIPSLCLRFILPLKRAHWKNTLLMIIAWHAILIFLKAHINSCWSAKPIG